MAILKNFTLSKPMLAFSKLFGRTEHPYALEGILRPALEFNSAIVSSCAAIPFLIAPQVFMMSCFYGFCVGGALLLFALRRSAQGLYCLQYKKVINQIPFFKVSIDDLQYKYANKRSKNNKNKLFIGKGFNWRNIHTQRFYDLETVTEFNNYLKEQTDNPLGGKPHLHGVGVLDEKDFYLTKDDRIGHVLCYGQSRSGKSRLLEMMLEQDIASGECVFLIDPKGDKDLFKRLLAAARRANRLDDVMVLHLGFINESVRYNPIASYQRITEVAGRISDKLPSEGQSQVFAMFAWRFVNIVAIVLQELGEPITIAQIKKHVSNLDGLFNTYACHVLQLDENSLATLLNSIDLEAIELPRHYVGKSEITQKLLYHLEHNKAARQDNEVLESLMNAYSYERSYYDKITASLLPFLEKLTALGEMVSPVNSKNQAHSSDKGQLPTLNLEEAIAQKKIVFLGLDGLSDGEIAKALGAMFFNDLVSLAGKLYKTKERFNPVYVHADEFNDVIGDSFIPLLNKAGGAGVIVHAYTQTDQDIELGFGGARLGNTKALVAKGNFRTVLAMRVATVETAKYFTQKVNEVTVKYSVSDTRTNDSDGQAFGTTASSGDKIMTDKVKLVDDASITNQSVGQLFAAKNGGQIYHVRCPLIEEDLTEVVGDIESQGLGNMIQAVNLRQFVFADQMAASHKKGKKDKKGKKSKKSKKSEEAIKPSKSLKKQVKNNDELTPKNEANKVIGDDFIPLLNKPNRVTEVNLPEPTVVDTRVTNVSQVGEDTKNKKDKRAKRSSARGVL